MERIASALRASSNLTRTARELGTDLPSLYIYARGLEELWKAYQEAVARSHERRGARGRASGFRP